MSRCKLPAGPALTAVTPLGAVALCSNLYATAKLPCLMTETALFPVEFLLSDTGQQALAELAADGPIQAAAELKAGALLRRRFTPEQTRALLTTAALRQQASERFEHAGSMLFTRAALEQSSAEVVARHRADRLTAYGARSIVDLCCSIGGDALALAQTMHVTAFELDPTRLRMAAHNVRVYGRELTIQCADVTQAELVDSDAVFFDPARRDAQGRRIGHVNHYLPPLATIDRWRSGHTSACVKISPAVDDRQLPADAEVEFVSCDGELKEAVLWYPPIGNGGRRATVLRGRSSTQVGVSGNDVVVEPVVAAWRAETFSLEADGRVPSLPVTEVGDFLYEPDPAVIRAHVVKELGTALAETSGLGQRVGQLDADIAYITAEKQQPTPFARCFQIVDHLPLHLKTLRSYLRERDVGNVVVKKRGSAVQPEQLRKQLKLRGKNTQTLVVTRHRGEQIVLVVEPTN